MTNSLRRRSSPAELKQRSHLEQFVRKVTGFPPSSENYRLSLEFAVSKLKFHNFPSTNEDLVDSRLQRLVDKFRIFGHDEKADILELLIAVFRHKRRAAAGTDNAMMFHDMLNFLLNLSNSPVACEYETTDSVHTLVCRSLPANHPNFISQAPPADTSLWKQIFKDDPLTGEHWRGSKSSAASLSCPENDEDDDDAFDNDDSDADNGDRLGYSFADQIQRKSQNPLGRLYPPPKMRPRQNNIRNDSRLLHFHAKQYWTENYAAIGIVKSLGQKQEDPCDPCSLAPLLKQYYLSNPGMIGSTSAHHFVSELDLIRETLFLISDSCCKELASFIISSRFTVYTYSSKDRSYNVSLKVTILHASEGSVREILSTFAGLASIIKELRLFSDGISLSSSQTLDAIKSAIQSILVDLLELVSKFETYFLNNTQIGQGVTSLLELKSAFDESCKSLQVLSQFLQRNIFPLLLNCKQRVKTRIENRTALIQINNPLFHVASMKNCDIATSILSSLYNQVRNTQLVIDQFPSSKHTCPLPTSHLINLAKAFSKAHSTHDMFMQLLIESSRPYMNMLAQWITEGAINDPKNEFMICMNATVDTSSPDYWNGRFKSRSTTMTATSSPTGPSFLTPFFDKILEIGKSLNIICQYSPEKIEKHHLGSSIDFDLRHLLTQEFSKTGQSSDEAVSSATNTTLESINQHGYMYPNFVEAHIGRYLLRGDLEGKHEVVETRLSEGSQSSSAPSLLQPSTWTPFELKMSRFLASIIQQRYETVGRVLVNTLCGGSSRRAALTDSNSSTLVIPHLYNMSNKFKQNRNKLERELKALSSFYFMLSGYVWHPFCAALFDRLKSKQSTHHTGASLYNMFMDVLAAAEEVETDRSARYSCIGFDAGRVGIRVTDEELLQGINGGVGGSSWVVKDIIHLLEGVRFDYEMKWPFTIIITPKSLEMYSRITVFLLQIKYSRQCLEIDCFTPRDNDGKGLGSIKSVPLSSSSAFKQGINKSSGMSGVGVSNISELRSKRIAFRMELMHFIIGLQTHLFSSVLYAEAERLVKEILPGCSNINDLIAAHERFIASVYNKCLLHGNMSSILGHMKKIMQISVRFGQLCNEFDRSSSSMLVGASSSSVYKSLSSMTLSSSKRQSLANVKSMPDLSSRTATSTTTATVAIPLDSSGEIKPGPNVVNSVAERQRQQLIEQMQQYRSDFCKSRQYCIDTLHALSSHGGGMPHLASFAAALST